MLAEPNLMATNGKEASFLAGGEFPYPVVSGTSGGTAAVSIEFKEYGIRLNFIPTITPRGTIRLQVAPEVSALDYTHEVQISGFEVPGITTRKVNTEVELADGQSFMIGGLLDKSITETFQKIPFTGRHSDPGQALPVGVEDQERYRADRDRDAGDRVRRSRQRRAADAEFPGSEVPAAQFEHPHAPAGREDAGEHVAAARPAIPVEKLIESMKPEKPLIIETANGRIWHWPAEQRVQAEAPLRRCEAGSIHSNKLRSRECQPFQAVRDKRMNPLQSMAKALRQFLSPRAAARRKGRCRF